MFGQAALGPGVGALDRSLLVSPGVQQGRQLVEGEDDVGAELVLNVHRHFRGEPVPVAVEVAGERDPVVVDVGHPGLALGDHLIVGQTRGVHGQDLLEPHPEAHHLEAPRIGERGAGPVHEPPETPGGLDDVGAGLEEEVVGVGQDRLGADARDRFGQDRLDGRLGADGDERRGLDLTVGGAHHTRPREPAGLIGDGLETKLAHRTTRFTQRLRITALSSHLAA